MARSSTILLHKVCFFERICYFRVIDSFSFDVGDVLTIVRVDNVFSAVLILIHYFHIDDGYSLTGASLNRLQVVS